MLMPSVLIIEDDEDGRRAIARLFARADWKVFEAADGDSGVELALRNRPEVILCDLLMPKSNGFQVCRTIRQQLQPTKIIVVSGRDYAVDRASALEAGADEFLLKPITWEVLRESIDRLLTQIPQRPRATTSAEELGSVPPRIKLWGVRGSLPVPGPATSRYGGNTSCVEVRADGEIIVTRRRHWDSWSRSGAGKGAGTGDDQADSSHYTHALGSHPGSAVLSPCLQQQKSDPDTRL